MSTELLVAIVVGYLVLLGGMLGWLVVTVREEAQAARLRQQR